MSDLSKWILGTRRIPHAHADTPTCRRLPMNVAAIDGTCSWSAQWLEWILERNFSFSATDEAANADWIAGHELFFCSTHQAGGRELLRMAGLDWAKRPPGTPVLVCVEKIPSRSTEGASTRHAGASKRMFRTADGAQDGGAGYELLVTAGVPAFARILMHTDRRYLQATGALMWRWMPLAVARRLSARFARQQFIHGVGPDVFSRAQHVRGLQERTWTLTGGAGTGKIKKPVDITHLL